MATNQKTLTVNKRRIYTISCKYTALFKAQWSYLDGYTEKGVFQVNEVWYTIIVYRYVPRRFHRKIKTCKLYSEFSQGIQMYAIQVDQLRVLMESLLDRQKEKHETETDPRD